MVVFLLISCGGWSPRESHGGTGPLEDPLMFANTHSSELLTIQSSEDALQVFSQSLAPSTGKGHRQQSKGASSSIPPPPEIQNAIIELMGGMVALVITNNPPEEKNTPFPDHPNTKALPPDINYQWLSDTTLFKTLSTITLIQTTLSSIQASSPSPQTNPDRHYRDFENHVDESLPTAADQPSPWVLLLQEQGTPGIHLKLKELLSSRPTSMRTEGDSNSSNTLYAEYYLQDRLVPHLNNQLQQLWLTLQSQSYGLILKQLPIIIQWQQQERERQTIARLCGAWLWTVHNHQNHQDHRMTVTFFPPATEKPDHQPTPTTVSVQGDSVYLEWIFPQGKQEDSLLLSNRDTIMEGTFKNSLGPYGSISGKRLSICKP